MNTRRVLSILAGVAVVAGVVAVGVLPRLGFLPGLGPAEEGVPGSPHTLSGAMGEPGESGGIGGPFTLINGAGETITEASFPGRYLLVYFGYTYCPDVCPTSLQTMTVALEQLDPALLAAVQPLFITIDPERDRPEDVAEYAGFFHPSLMGLTGTPAQVAAAAAAYQVYHARAEQPQSAAGYLMDHSAITYLMAPDGSLAAFFRHGDPPEAMAETLTRILSGPDGFAPESPAAGSRPTDDTG